MFQVTTMDLKRCAEDTRTAAWIITQDFFGKPTNLTVSGQLNGETYAMAFSNIYTFGPTFRAENSNTTRHAAEFWMIEPEIAFADLEDDMILAESMLKYVIRYVLENAPEEMNFFNSLCRQGTARPSEQCGEHLILPVSPIPRQWRFWKNTTTSLTTRYPGAAICRPSMSAI